MEWKMVTAISLKIAKEFKEWFSCKFYVFIEQNQSITEQTS